MTSTDAAPAESPICALLRRVLIALGVALAFVVAGLLLSADRASAAESDEPPVAGLLSAVGETVEATVGTVDAVVVDAVVAPVEQVATPIVAPVLAPVLTPVVETVEAVLPAAPAAALEPVVAAVPEADAAPRLGAAPIPTAADPITAALPTSIAPDPAPSRTVGPVPADDSAQTSAPTAVAVASLAPTLEVASPTTGEISTSAAAVAPAAPVFPSDSTPD